MESSRAFWKGNLRLSLVIIPVRLLSATRSESQLRLHQVDRKTKQRIKYQKVLPGGKVVDKDDIVSAYQVESGSYVLFEDDELDAVKLKTKHTIELTQFVESCEIDPLYFERPYYVIPDGDVAEEGYCVIRDALRAERKVGIGQLTLRGREELIALEPVGRGLALQTLRYDEEIKDDEQVFSGVKELKVRSDLIEMATELITRKSGKFEPAAFKNNYTAALRKLVEEKLKTGKVVDVEGEDDTAASNVVDFMEALKRSVAQSTDRSGKDEPSPRRSSKRAPSKPNTRAVAGRAQRGSRRATG